MKESSLFTGLVVRCLNEFLCGESLCFAASAGPMQTIFLQTQQLNVNAECRVIINASWMIWMNLESNMNEIWMKYGWKDVKGWKIHCVSPLLCLTASETSQRGHRLERKAAHVAQPHKTMINIDKLCISQIYRYIIYKYVYIYRCVCVCMYACVCIIHIISYICTWGRTSYFGLVRKSFMKGPEKHTCLESVMSM